MLPFLLFLSVDKCLLVYETSLRQQGIVAFSIIAVFLLAISHSFECSYLFIYSYRKFAKVFILVADVKTSFISMDNPGRDKGRSLC